MIGGQKVMVIWPSVGQTYKDITTIIFERNKKHTIQKCVRVYYRVEKVYYINQGQFDSCRMLCVKKISVKNNQISVKNNRSSQTVGKSRSEQKDINVVELLATFTEHSRWCKSFSEKFTLVGMKANCVKISVQFRETIFEPLEPLYLCTQKVHCLCHITHFWVGFTYKTYERCQLSRFIDSAFIELGLVFLYIYYANDLWIKHSLFSIWLLLLLLIIIIINIILQV